MEADKAVKRKTGRPVGSSYRKFTEETIEDILKGVRIGLTFKSAAVNAGIAEGTMHQWMEKGRKGLKPYADFLRRCEKAIEEAKAFHLGMINMHAKGGHKATKRTIERDASGNIIKTIEVTEETLPSLRASQWLLERRHPQEFGQKQEVAVTNGDNPFEVSLFGKTLVGSAEDEIVEPTGDDAGR